MKPPIPKPNPIIFNSPFSRAIYLSSDSEVEFIGDNQLRIQGEDSQTVVLTTVHTIVIFGEITLDSYAIFPILKSGTSIVFFSVNGEFLGRLDPAYTVKPDVIRAQALITSEQQLHLTQRIIWGSLRNNRRFLTRSIRERKDEVAEFTEAVKQLDFAIKEIHRKEDLRAVAGLLGAGLSKYYLALNKTIRGSTWEHGYRRSQEITPFNLMLDFVYKLLEEEIATALAIHNLDPNQGIWHSPSYRGRGLIKELSLEFKAFAEAVVIRCINRQQIALKDFDGQPRSLPRPVVRTLAKEFERKMGERFTYPLSDGVICTYQEAIEVQARQLALYLIGAIPEFCPLNVK
jgi:CRISP-associated protein Cas1